jgi:rubredoxin
MAFCTKCGEPLEDGAILCAECGTGVGAAVQGNAARNTVSNDLNKESNAVSSSAMCDNGSCPYGYNSNEGDPEHGIPPGTPFNADWVCPLCGKKEWLIKV